MKKEQYTPYLLNIFILKMWKTETETETEAGDRLLVMTYQFVGQQKVIFYGHGPSGGSRIFRCGEGGADLQRRRFLAETCAKRKELGPVGGGGRRWISQKDPQLCDNIENNRNCLCIHYLSKQLFLWLFTTHSFYTADKRVRHLDLSTCAWTN